MFCGGIFQLAFLPKFRLLRLGRSRTKTQQYKRVPRGNFCLWNWNTESGHAFRGCWCERFPFCVGNTVPHTPHTHNGTTFWGLAKRETFRTRAHVVLLRSLPTKKRAIICVLSFAVGNNRSISVWSNARVCHYFRIQILLLIIRPRAKDDI